MYFLWVERWYTLFTDVEVIGGALRLLLDPKPYVSIVGLVGGTLTKPYFFASRRLFKPQ